MEWKNIFNSVRKYGFKSIVLRNLIIILIVTLIPFSAIGLMVYNQTSSSLENESMSLYEEKSSVASTLTLGVFKQLDRLKEIIIQDVSVRKILLNNEEKINLDNEFREISIMLSNYILLNDYISKIELYSAINNSIVSEVTRKSDTGFDYQSTFCLYRDKINEMTFYPGEDRYDHENLAVVSPIISGSENLGYVSVHVNIKKLFMHLGTATEDSGEILLVTDSKNRILLSSDREIYGKNMLDIFGTDKIENYMNYNDKTYIVSSKNFDDIHRFVYMYDDSYYHLARQKLNRILVIFIIGFVLFSMFISLLLTVRISRPFSEIISSLGPSHNLDIKDANETEYIVRNILDITTKNAELIKENNIRLDVLRKAQMHALQNQINPHFICNSLETIKWKCMEMGMADSEAAEMVDLLSDIFRYCVDMKEYLVDLNTEINNARFYISVLKIRYRNKLEVEWDIDESLLNQHIVKLCLQPIIENAFYHGIKPTRKSGIINIKVAKADKFTEIYVSDNGAGMTPETLSKLRSKLSSNNVFEGNGIGLNNVNLRLKLLFGDDSGVFIDSAEGAGTTVTLRFGSERSF